MNENSTHHQLIEKISQLIQPMSYEVVYLEMNPSRRTLRVFIDHLDRTDGVGIEDCVNVTRAISEPLDLMPEINQVFGETSYELEVSSPGIDRPLRNERDFEKFKGREIRIQLFRAATGEELSNPDYAAKNPKQKNFLGTLKGFFEGKVIIAVNLTGGHDDSQKPKLKKGQKPSKSAQKKAEKMGLTATGGTQTNSEEVVVSIPLPLIAKANLEPDFDALEENPSALVDLQQESER